MSHKSKNGLMIFRPFIDLDKQTQSTLRTSSLNSSKTRAIKIYRTETIFEMFCPRY